MTRSDRPPSRRGIDRRSLLGALATVSLPGSARQAAAQASPSARWLPLSGEKALERIAFGSCLDQRLAQPIWKPVLAARPDVFVMLGDNVYGDVSDGELRELRAAYALQSAQPELAAVRARVPFLATWDDHDYGLNDASAAFPYKAGARALFAEFWGIPRAELPPEGIYRSVIIGPPGRRVQIILLDLRWFRSALAENGKAARLAGLRAGKYKPDRDPDKTMLGAAQWAWLDQQLRRPAEIRLVVSSTQLLAEAHGWERWGHLPAERERLFRLIGETGAEGIIVLSGDRHRSAIYRRSEGLPYPLYDVTSSSLNRGRAGSDPDDPGRLGPMLAEENFGLMTIDWAGRRIKAAILPLSGLPGPAVDLAFAELGVAGGP